MGYVSAIGMCFGCSKPFSFNPMKVPSLTVNGSRVPVCADCVVAVNPMRKANGLPPIVPAPDAYEACDEGDIA